MPELPEAESIVRGLAGQLVDTVICRARLARKDIVRQGPTGLARRLASRRVVGVYRRGKRIAITLDPPATLVFALGMTGRLMVVAGRTAVAAHTHLRVVLDDGQRELRFRDPRRFGGVWFFENGMADEECAPLALGPEPLELSLGDFRELLRRRRQIKALLLDQRVIAGLGNIYCDESLHRAGIHPLTRADGLTDLRSSLLWRAIRAVLNAAIRAGGSTISDYRNANGDEGFFQSRHRVYGREGQPCRRCRTPIKRIQAAGRSSYLCPRCQPAS